MLHIRYAGRAALTCLLLILTSRQLPAQTARPQTVSPAARPEATDAATLGRGWTALAAGRSAEAVAAADQILRRVPWSHPAMALRIEGLAAGDPIRGLDAYEAWLGARTVEDHGLLEPIARAVLDQIARGREPDLAREALKLLARARVVWPAGQAPKSVSGDPFSADGTLAAGGDAAALQRLADAAVAPETRDKRLVAEALEAAGPAGVPALQKMLNDRVGPNRAAAADALGRLGAATALDALRESFKDPDPFIRSAAAVALARLHDPEGQAYVDRMLESDVPDLRLAAAAAWNGQDGPWVAAIRPLLENRDGLNRVRAAQLIAPIDPESARRTLEEASGDPNPVMRAESIRITAELARQQPAIADTAQLRRLLRDPDATVRLSAAAALMALARNGR